MPRQLNQSGQSVPLVIMIHAALPSGMHRDRWLWLKRQVHQLRVDGARGLVQRVDEKLGRRSALKRRSSAGPDADEERLDQLRRGAYFAAARRYDHNVARYPGRTMLIKAQDSGTQGSIRLDPDYGWGHRLTGQFDIYTVPGDHLGVLSDPQVQRTAEIIKEALGQMNSRQSSGHTTVGIDEGEPQGRRRASREPSP